MVASSKTLIQYHSQDIISGKGHQQNKETLAHPCLLCLYSQYTTQGISLQPSQGRTDKEYVVNSHNGILVSCKEYVILSFVATLVEMDNYMLDEIRPIQTSFKR
jgi:hypothetical protein